MLKKRRGVLIISLACLLAMTGCRKTEEDSFGALHGMVIDVFSGEPVSNASITIIPSGKTLTTGSDGLFQYESLAPGQYFVQAKTAIHKTNTKTVRVEASGVSRVDIPLRKGEQKLRSDPEFINLGGTQNSCSFSIYNEGVQEISWEIKYDACAWIKSISPLKGQLDFEGSQKINILIDREKLFSNNDLVLLKIFCGEAEEEMSIPLSISKYAGAGGGNTPELPRLTVPNGLYVYYQFENDLLNSTQTPLHAAGSDYVTYATRSDGSKAIQLGGPYSTKFSVGEGLIDNRNASISFWIGGMSGDGHIFSLTNNNPGSYKTSFLLCMVDNKLRFIIDDFNINNQFNVRPSFSHNNIANLEWHMVTITIEPNTHFYSTIKLYVDGFLSDTVSEDNPDTNDFGRCTRLTFGGSLTTFTRTLSAVTMAVDNLRVYKTRTLNAAEVKQIYDAEK